MCWGHVNPINKRRGWPRVIPTNNSFVFVRIKYIQGNSHYCHLGLDINYSELLAVREGICCIYHRVDNLFKWVRNGSSGKDYRRDNTWVSRRGLDPTVLNLENLSKSTEQKSTGTGLIYCRRSGSWIRYLWKQVLVAGCCEHRFPPTGGIALA